MTLLPSTDTTLQAEIDRLRARIADLERQLHSAEPNKLDTACFQHAQVLLSATRFDGTFERLNPYWIQTLGYSVEELTSQPFLSFVHPDDQAATLAEIERISTLGIDSFAFENRYRCKDGSYRHFLWTSTVVPEEERIYATALDITEQKQAETALLKQTRMLELILENMSDSVIVADTDGHFLLFNQPAQHMLGAGAVEGGAEVWSEAYGLFYPDQTTLYAAEDLPLAHAIAGHVSNNVEMFVRHARVPEGLSIMVSGRPLRDAAGQLQGGMVICRDITEQKRAEEAILQTVRQEEMIRAQSAALEQLSTPLMPISNEIVVMPLIGVMDSRRAQQVMDTLLQGVAETHAQVAILDITGVSVVDTQVANALMRAAQAVKLLGTRVLLTGIRPEVAQTLVGLGIDLTGIMTYSTLQAGIAAMWQRH
jgi:rsbT co-antagonist protein RsbR